MQKPSLNTKELSKSYRHAAWITAAAMIVVGVFGAWYAKRPAVASPNTFVIRVSDASTAAAIPGAKTSLEGQGLPDMVFTDSEGIASFAPRTPLPAEFHLRVDATGYDSYDRRLEVTDRASTYEVRLAPKRVSASLVSGGVRDQHDKPVQGVTVTVDDMSDCPPVETSSDGLFAFSIKGKQLGDLVRLRFVKDGYTPNPGVYDAVVGRAPMRVVLNREK